MDSISSQPFYMYENILDILELDLNEPMDQVNEDGELCLEAILLSDEEMDQEPNLKRKIIHHDDDREIKRMRTDNSILNEWNALSAQFAQEICPTIVTIEAYSNAFDNIKSKIITKLPSSKKEEKALERIRFLLKMIHPCPLTEDCMDREIEILRESKELCRKISRRNSNCKGNAKLTLENIINQHQPILIYNFASDMSKKTDREIDALEKDLKERTINEDKRTDAWLRISELLHEEIQRFERSLIASQKIADAIYVEQSEIALGNCYDRLGDVNYDSQQDFEPLEPLQNAIAFWKEAKKYYKNYPSKNENVRLIDDWIAYAQQEIQKICNETHT